MFFCNKIGNKMESTTAYLMEYTVNRSDLAATERWTEETKNSTVLVDAGNVLIVFRLMGATMSKHEGPSCLRNNTSN